MTLLAEQPRAALEVAPDWDVPEAEPPRNADGELLRILNVNNHHAGPGGYEVYFRGLTTMLRNCGHHVATLERNNAEIVTIGQKLDAFRTSVASRRAAVRMRELIEAERIDLVHLHNVLPLISPSVINGCRQAYGGRGVPVVMKLADYKLTCPAGQHLRDGKVCTKCIGGREYWAAVHGCRENRVWSTAYAVRNVAARWRGIFRDGVTLFLPNTQFVLEHFVSSGFERESMHLLPNFTELAAPPRDEIDFGAGDYAAYVGRISPEKGLPTLIEAARRTAIPLRVAGDHSNMPGLAESAPENVTFVGKLSRDELPGFYRNARFLVVPSEWYECFGLTAAEAQTSGLPVIANAMGGLPEVVRHDVSGLVVEPGDPAALATVMERLWTDDDLAARLGRGGFDRAAQQFRPTVFYRRVAAAYERAITLHAKGQR